MKLSFTTARSLLFLLIGLGGLGFHSAFTDDSRNLQVDQSVIEQCLAKGLESAALGRSRVNPRDQYVAENLDKKFTSVDQNRRFIEVANATAPGSRTLFIHNENAVMKKLNDSFQEKNFVTSMNNRYTEILLEKFRLLEGKSPGLQIYISRVDPYHDFKTSARAITWKGSAPPDFVAELNSAVQAADKEFTGELLDRKLLRQSDIEIGWYRTGTGDTADRASIAARVARILGDENRVVNFDEPWVKILLDERLVETENARKNLEGSLASRVPFVGEAGKATPSEQVFDLIRKCHEDPDVLRSFVVDTFHLNDFSREEAVGLLNYAKDVDRFSPSLRIEKREIVSLDDAPFGGFTADFLGLGSSNLASVASALAKSKNLDHALVATRQAEIEVTREFKEKLRAFHKIVGDIARCGGDDCVGMPKDRAFTQAEKTALVNRLAANPLTRRIRMAFVDEGVGNPGDRTKIATQGEDVEKELRKNLLARPFTVNTARISASRLSDFTIAIDMRTTEIFKGQVDFIIGSQAGKEPTLQELILFRQALNEAVAEINRKISSRTRSSRYRSAKEIYTVLHFER